MRTLFIAPVLLLALSACGDADLGEAGRNAAWAAVEAADPEIVQGLRAAQTLRQAAATCGWQDVDAGALAQVGVSGIENPALRAAAASLVEDLLAGQPLPGAEAAATTCSPETRAALEAQIAAMAGGGEGEGAGEGWGDGGG